MAKQVHIALLVLLVVAVPAHAADAGAGVDAAGDIVSAYSEAFRGYEQVISAYAKNLFYLLATLALALSLVKSMYEQGDLSMIVGILLKQALIVGFFGFIIDKWPELSAEIVQSFREMATKASGIDSITPGALVSHGLELLASTVERASMWSPVVSGAMLAVTVVVLIIYAAIAAVLTLTLVEMYLMLTGGIIFLAFSALEYTREFSINQMKYPLKAGAKLFVVQILAGVGDTFISKMTSQKDPTLYDIGTIAVSVVILYLLVKEIPNVMASIISGESFAGGSSMGSMAAGMAGGVAGGAIGAASATIAGAAAISAAVDMAKASGSQSVAKGAMKNLVSGLTTEAANTAMASPKSTQGSYWGRAAQNLVSQAAEAAKKKN